MRRRTEQRLIPRHAVDHDVEEGADREPENADEDRPENLHSVKGTGTRH